MVPVTQPDQFPWVAPTTHYKLGGLKQCKFILRAQGGLKVQNKGQEGPCPSEMLGSILFCLILTSMLGFDPCLSWLTAPCLCIP